MPISTTKSAIDIEIVFDYRVVACPAFMMTQADLGAAKARAVCS
jgi:hypothetical protein